MPPSRVSDFRLLAPFAALPDEELAALAEACPRVSLLPGDVTLPANAPTSRIAVLVGGDFVERDVHGVSGVVRAPAVVGLASALASTHPHELRARTAAEVIYLEASLVQRLAREHPRFAEALTVTLATEAERARADLRETLRRQEAGPFLGAGARVAPGPYFTEPHALFAFFMRDAPARIAARLPPGLRPLPGLTDTWLLVLHAQARRVPEPPSPGAARAGTLSSIPAVDEVTALVPCLGPRLRPSVYVAAMYTPGLFALLSARDIHGLPARFGRIARTAHGFDLVTGGELLAQASWQGEAAVELAGIVPGLLPDVLGRPLAGTRLGNVLSAGWAQLRLLGIALSRTSLGGLPLFVHRQRGREVARSGEASGDRWAVDQLVQIPLQVRSFEEMHALDRPRVELAGEIDGLGGRAMAGISARASFTWGAARERVDYTARSLFSA
jgi:CRP-like cAMP-binding protein